MCDKGPVNVSDLDTLIGHASAGAPLGYFCVKKIYNKFPLGATVSDYRIATSTALDLVVETDGKKSRVK